MPVENSREYLTVSFSEKQEVPISNSAKTSLQNNEATTRSRVKMSQECNYYITNCHILLPPAGAMVSD